MKPFRLSAFVLFTLCLSIAAPSSASEYTVGQFIQQLAENKRLDASSPRVAAASLAALGTPIPSTLDLSKRMTEGDIVEISGAIGLRLITTRPDAPFGRVRVDRFLKIFSAELGFEDPNTRNGDDQGEDESDGEGDGEDEGDGPAFDPFSKGKGKGKQIVTETEI